MDTRDLVNVWYLLPKRIGASWLLALDPREVQFQGLAQICH